MEDPGGIRAPDQEPFLQILIILAVILAGGFFALFENALVSARKSRMRAMAEGGEQKYRRALDAAENPEPFLSASRIWIAFLRILAGLLGGFNLIRPLGDRLLPGGEAAGLSGDLLAGAAVIAAFTLAAVILGDFLPKLIAFSAPEKICAGCLPLIAALSLPWKPLLGFYAGASALTCRIFKIGDPSVSGITEDELRNALAEGEKSGVVESKERTMVEGVFYLGDRNAGAFMTHRSEIEWLDLDAGFDKIRDMVKNHAAQGCFPVARGELDKIAGAVYLKDILQAIPDGLPQGLKPLIRKVPFVPETMSALKAFEAFKRGRTDYLFVMDEYGGFAGLLSVRDLVEEIVGQLSESAPEEEELLPQGDGSWLADGSVSIDDVGQVLELSSLNTEGRQDYHTLAGFILDLAGEMPRPDAKFSYNGYEFKVVSMEGNRIDRVLIRKI
ncbi:MAG: hemolysin family protein [Treponema sp.]|jgi:putative hemolysin|nr:hemolysin family protein [Treponema sp.]